VRTASVRCVATFLGEKNWDCREEIGCDELENRDGVAELADVPDSKSGQPKNG